jgi:GNAT superfamily N-acetyltransferase
VKFLWLIGLFTFIGLSPRTSFAQAAPLCHNLLVERLLISTLPGVYIRQAKNEDLEPARQFIVRMRANLEVNPEQTADAKPLFNDFENYENSYLKSGKFYVLVDENSRIIGTGGYVALNGYTCELKKFYVDPSLQGRGVGKSFLSSIVEKSKQMSFRKMTLQTNRRMEAAIGLYKKLGFQQFGQSSENESAVYYELDLTH